ncbi:hypothetical protein LCGC14_1227870 [marine sediment metagenome]|uniref:Uncharacterized protein n=1 Tax=marine sediment metagenome TaxID=412755 RepID=A0A0F9LDF8_9ZZZZ|nr:hypothetical protein [Candidatus Scalindua sp.]
MDYMDLIGKDVILLSKTTGEMVKMKVVDITALRIRGNTSTSSVLVGVRKVDVDIFEDTNKNYDALLKFTRGVEIAQVKLNGFIKNNRIKDK